MDEWATLQWAIDAWKGGRSQFSIMEWHDHFTNGAWSANEWTDWCADERSWG